MVCRVICIPFKTGKARYLAFLGRISREKGVERAIEIARRSGYALKIAAKIYDEDVPYFEHVVEPLIKSNSSFVEFLGEVGERPKMSFSVRQRQFSFLWSGPSLSDW